MQILCRSVKLGQQHRDTFPVAVCPGAADDVYCLLDSGVLALLRPQGQGVHKWVNAKMGRGTSLSACAAGVAVAGADSTLRIFAPGSLQHIATLPKPSALAAAAGGAGGAGGMDPEADSDSDPTAASVAVDRTGSFLSAVYMDHSLSAFEVRDPRRITRPRHVQGHRRVVWGAATHSVPGLGPTLAFATCSADGTIKLWGLERGDRDGEGRGFSPVLLTIKAPSDDLRCVRWSPDGAYVAAADTSGNIHVFDTSIAGTSSHVCSVEAHDGEILSLDFAVVDLGDIHGTTLLLASSGRDGLVHILEARRDFSTVQTLDGHAGSVTAVRFAEAGRKLITCGADRAASFWSLSDTATTTGDVRYQLVRREVAGAGVLHDCDVELTSQYAATIGHDRQLRLWDLDSCSFLDAHEGPPVEAGEGTRVCIDPSGLMAACCFADGSLRLYDLNSGDVLGLGQGHGDLLLGAAFLPDSSRIVTVGGDGCVFVWNVPQGPAR